MIFSSRVIIAFISRKITAKSLKNSVRGGNNKSDFTKRIFLREIKKSRGRSLVWNHKLQVRHFPVKEEKLEINVTCTKVSGMWSEESGWFAKTTSVRRFCEADRSWRGVFSRRQCELHGLELTAAVCYIQNRVKPNLSFLGC